MEGAPMFNPDVAGNGSSITVLVKRGRIVYNAIDIATAAIMIKITILFLFIYSKTSPNYRLDSFALPNRVEKALHQMSTVLYFARSVPVGIS